MSTTTRLLLALVAASLLLAGCAGQGAEDEVATSSGDTATFEVADRDDEVAADTGGTLVAAAVDASAAYSTARMRYTTVTQTPDGPVEATGEGVSDGAAGAAHMTMTIRGAAAAFGEEETTVEVIVLDGTIYQRFPQLIEQLGGDAEWLSIDLAAMVPGFETMLDQARQMDPAESMDQLRDLADVEEVGRETVAGIDTTHYRGTTTARAALAATGMAQSDLEDFLAAAGLDLDAPIPVGVWIDDEGLVRRHSSSLDLPTGATTSTYEILEYGLPVEVTAPPAADTVSFEELTQQQASG